MANASLKVVLDVRRVKDWLNPTPLYGPASALLVC
jgi:hypothetical protein